jgi:hypothetical protein
VAITLLLLLSAAAWAQSLNVYSEFARIDKAGNVTDPQTPREVLSPALVRSGFTSFQVVVQADADVRWKLLVGQNPENAVRVTIYRESGDDLQSVELPVNGQGAQVFWMDLWTEDNAPVRRIKVEPELNAHEDWITYPMEARVMNALVPRADSVAPICRVQRPPAGNTIPSLQFRNAAQDGAMASRLSGAEQNKLRSFCEGSLSGGSLTEGYFKIRDYLFRLR